MSWRDVNGLDIRFGSIGGTDLLASVDQRSAASGFGREVFEMPAEDAFSAAERGAIDQKAEMLGDAKAARVSDSLTVKHDNIRRDSEVFPCLKQWKAFAEGQESGDIRKGETACRDPGRYGLERFDVDHDKRRMSDVREPIVRNISSRYETNLSNIERLNPRQFSQFVLHQNGFAWR